MPTEPLVYYQSSPIWSPEQQLALSLADNGLDAIIFQADELFPTEGPNSVIPLIDKLNERGIITVIQPKERANSKGTMQAVQAGAISLGTNYDNPLTLTDRVSRILRSHSNNDSRKRAISAELHRGPVETDFWHPTFDTDYHLTFINDGKLPHSTLLDYLNKIPTDSSTVINCGHIDNRDMKPDALSIETFRQGVQALKYLEAKGHRNVRLSVLVNDMYEFDSDPDAARRALDKRRRQYKSTGVHDLFPEEYRQILREYGVDMGRWPVVLIPKIETALKFAASQKIDAHQQGQESPFSTDLTEHSGHLAYTIGSGSDAYQVPLTSSGKAPICRMVAAEFFRELEVKGAANIVHLYPSKYEGSTTGGIRAARNLYGTNAHHQVFFFSPAKDGVNIARRDVA